MTWKRWLFTGVSFALVIAVSIWTLLGWWREGSTISLPPSAHLWALSAVALEILARTLKITWSGKAVHIHVPFTVALRTILAGDFGASVTPGRTGAEPTRFLVLAEAGVPTASALVVLYAELFLELLSLVAIVALVALLFHEAGAVVLGLVGMVSVYALTILGVGVAAVVLSRQPPAVRPPGWARRIRVSERRWAGVEKGLVQVRATVAAVRDVRRGWAVGSFLASAVHVAARLCVLPAIVLASGMTAPLAPMIVWPLGLLYGAAVVPAPGGGGAVELAFSAALDDVIGREFFGAALLWWRFYTFYIYILLGALAAGRTAMRALRKKG